MPNKPSIAFVHAVSVAVALLLSACAPIAGGQLSQAAAPIKIGMVTSLTGNFAPLGANNRLGVQQVVDQQNAQGGIDGRKLDLTVVDDGSDPNQTVVQYNRLLDNGVSAVIGTPQTTANLAIRGIANDRKSPTIALAAGDPQVVPATPYMWMTSPLSSQIAATCLQYMQAHSMTRVAMLSDSTNAFAVTGHDAAQHSLASSGVALVDDE